MGLMDSKCTAVLAINQMQKTFELKLTKSADQLFLFSLLFIMFS